MLKKYDEAISCYKKVLSERQLSLEGRANILTQLGNIYCYGLKKRDEAISCYKQLLAIHQLSPEDRAHILVEQLGDIEYKNVLPLTQASAPELGVLTRAVILAKLGFMYSLAQKYEEAIPYIEKALALPELPANKREIVGAQLANCKRFVENADDMGSSSSVGGAQKNQEDAVEPPVKKMKLAHTGASKPTKVVSPNQQENGQANAAWELSENKRKKPDVSKSSTL